MDKNMMSGSKNKVILMRSIPGGGKSTYIRKHFPDAVICSADDYFVKVLGKGKKYAFDPKKLGDAHNWCKQKFLDALTADKPLVVVDNTNTRVAEMSYYVSTARVFGYDVEIVRLDVDPEVAAKRNVHGVPPDKVKAMADRMEKVPSGWKETVVKE